NVSAGTVSSQYVPARTISAEYVSEHLSHASARRRTRKLARPRGQAPEEKGREGEAGRVEADRRVGRWNAPPPAREGLAVRNIAQGRAPLPPDCEDQISKQDGRSDPRFAAASGRSAFGAGEPGRRRDCPPRDPAAQRNSRRAH